MKTHRLIPILFLLFLFGNANAQTTKTYELHFNRSDFKLVQDKDTDAIHILPQGGLKYFLKENTSYPALPLFSRNILISPEKDLKNYKMEVTGKEVLRQNVKVAPCPKVVPTSNQVKHKGVLKVNYPPDIYPKQNVDYVNLRKMRNYRFLGFIVCPFRYDSETKELTFYSHITITLELKSAREGILSSYGKAQGFRDIVKDVVINPGEAETLYPISKTKASKSPTSNAEYLIVTSENLKDYFQPLMDWKIQKGISAEIVTTEDIYSNYSGATYQLTIKNCLEYYYNNKNLKWVLLGGDDTVVPVQGCFCRDGDTTVIDTTIPCDLFYACFDGSFNWNADEDNLVGETNDNIDMDPEIYISRAPIRSAKHVKAFVGKTLSYVKNPTMDNHMGTMLLSGAKYFNTWDDRSDADYRSEWMYSFYNLDSIWTGTKTKFYDTGTDFSGDDAYDVTVDNIQEQLNNAYHFVHMATHGYQTAWETEVQGEPYYNTSASNLINHNKSIFLTTACNTNAFDGAENFESDPCLSEALIRNPDGGAILYWGSSRNTLIMTASVEYGGSAFQFNGNFYENLYTGQPSSDKYKFAAVTTASKVQSLPDTSYTQYRWMQFTLNAIGDPELPIYVEDPSRFADVTIEDDGSTVTVNAGVSGCTICVMSKDDVGDSYWEVESNTSSHTFYSVPEPYTVTITKANHVPYTYDSDEAGESYMFVQNKSLDQSDLRIFSQQDLDVGSDVTDNVSDGPVTIKDGANVVLDAGRNVTIKNDFEIEQGGEFSIEMQNPYISHKFYEKKVILADKSNPLYPWRTIDLDDYFTNMVVCMGPISYEDTRHPAHVRIQNLGVDTFEFKIAHWDYDVGYHNTEGIGYVVMKQGSYSFGGLKAEAGIIDDVDHNFKTHTFSQNFSKTPVILTQVVTMNESDAVVTRLDNISTSQFDVKLQEQESLGSHADEKVAYIAIEPGYGSAYGQRIEVGRTANAVTDAWHTISFENHFSSNSPTFVAQIQTYDGSDPCGLRRKDLTSSSVKVFCEEEQSADSETSHASEVVGYIVVQ